MIIVKGSDDKDQLPFHHLQLERRAPGHPYQLPRNVLLKFVEPQRSKKFEAPVSEVCRRRHNYNQQFCLVTLHLKLPSFQCPAIFLWVVLINLWKKLKAGVASVVSFLGRKIPSSCGRWKKRNN